MSETEQPGSPPPAPTHDEVTTAPKAVAGEGLTATGTQNPAQTADGQEPEPVAAPGGEPSPGAMLRAARESAGLERSALAMALKVSVRKLEALEDDQFDQLPDLVFARALASSVCRTLKVDARDILARFPQTHAPRLHNDDSGLNTPFRTPADLARTPWLDRLSRPMVLTALAILLGAIVIIFFPNLSPPATGTVTEAVPHAAVDAGVPPTGPEVASEPAPGPAGAGPATPSPVAAAVTVATVTTTSMPATPSTSPMPAATTSAAPQPGRTGVAPAPASAPAPAPAVVAHAAPSAISPAAPPPPAGPAKPVAASLATVPVPLAASTAPAAPAPRPVASGAAAPTTAAASGSTRQIAFKARGPSWIEVLDASGNVLISRQVGAGEVASATGVGPLRVTVGRTDLTEVTYQGKPFDLGPYAKQGVARFEVKP